jgi:GxxExxY protein
MQPQMHTDEHRLKTGFSDVSEFVDSRELTQRIIGCAYRVANSLGCGFIEKVYENALLLELRSAGLQVQQQAAIQVRYNGSIVGEYVADLIVERAVIIEIKAVKALDDMHAAQCLN